ncbi:MAG: N-acetyl-gamma-glutamyl-phosphate reductase [Marivirga sp.]|jgi:N-acetyl-gamma-glutamyl-phosphate reductase
MITVGIIGSSGYVAGELLRCLLHHPEVDIVFLYSHSQEGWAASDVHQDLQHHKPIEFSHKINYDVDVVYLCLGHGKATSFLKKHSFSVRTKIIDLSNDFRLEKTANFGHSTFVYGLPELNHHQIEEAQYIANPGCFATAIQLALLPLANKQALQDDVHVHALTGSTGAGQGFSDTSHFSWRNNNVSLYKPFNHQHLAEIGEGILSLQPNFKKEVNFIPIRGNFTRGIFASIYVKSELPEDEVLSIFKRYYEHTPFTHIVASNLHLKQVVNTNHCYLQIQKIGDKILITSAIDNLLKGAAGQAIQNMNIMSGIDQQTGLHLKANYH